MNSFVFIAIIAGLAYALSTLLQKHLVGKIDVYTVAWSRYLFSTPFLLIMLWKSGIPKINPIFWPIVIITALIEILTAVIFAKALKSSALSKTIPFLAFGPFFIALGGFIILKESLSLLQILAMFLIVFGSYILNVHKNNSKHILAPVKLIWKERGGVYLLFLCIICGIDVPFSKKATLYSSPEFLHNSFFLFNQHFLYSVLFEKK
jgi:drug/metabolite transporter (DMT)-like permease